MKLDPRTKLFILLWCNYLLLGQIRGVLEMVTVIFLAALFVLANKKKTGLIYSFVYFIMLITDYYMIERVGETLSMVLIFFAVSLRLLLPSMMAGVYLMQTTKLGELTLGLQKIKIPDTVLIPVVVTARFLPTIKQDYQHIRDAMKFRGIFLSGGDIVKHPVLFFEYILIPMMMAAGETAQDLTVASLAKGISRNNKKTSINQIGFHGQDIICCLLIISFFAVYQVL